MKNSIYMIYVVIKDANMEVLMNLSL